MGNLDYIDESVAKLVNNEVVNFLYQFNKSTSDIVPLLVFPMNMGAIINKCIRYHAAIYNLVALYIDINDNELLVLCQHHHLKPYSELIYNNKCRSSDEDTERVNPYQLYICLDKSIASMSSNWKRRNFGLDIKKIADESNQDDEKPLIDSHSSPDLPVTFLGLDKSESNHVPKKDSELYLHSSSTSMNVDKCESSQVSNGMPELLLYANDNYQEVLSNHQLPALQEDLLATPPIVNKVFENGHPEDSETIPTFAPEGNIDIKYYRQKVLEMKLLMSEILECVVDLPLLVRARNKYEPYFNDYTKDKLNTVVELFNIPKCYTTIGILSIFNFGTRLIKWCDDSHALLIFVRRDHADMALILNHPYIHARSMVDASPIATTIACMMDFPKIFNHLHTKERNYKK